MSAILLLHAGDQGSYLSHVRVHGRVVSDRWVAASASSTGIGDVGHGVECLDRLQVLEDYVTVDVVAHTLCSRLDGELLVWNVQSSCEACLLFDVVGCLFVGPLSSFPKLRHECGSTGVTADVELLLETGDVLLQR